MAIDQLVKEIKTIVFKKTKALNYKLLKEEPFDIDLFYNFKISDLIISIGLHCDGPEFIFLWQKKDLVLRYEADDEASQGRIFSYFPGEWEELIYNYYDNLKGEKPVLFDRIQRKYQNKFLKNKKKLAIMDYPKDEVDDGLPF